MDQKNIGLAKILYGLRQDLDIYCLISVNVKKIKERGIGKSFFGHLQRLAFRSITLNICKIFEEEKGYELNSIPGVFHHLITETPNILNDAKLRDFIQKYHGPSDFGSPISALQSTIDGFRDKLKVELDRFKAFRDKKKGRGQPLKLDNSGWSGRWF